MWFLRPLVQTELAMISLGKQMFVKWFGAAKHTTQPAEDEKVDLMSYVDVFGCASTAPYLQVGISEC